MDSINTFQPLKPVEDNEIEDLLEDLTNDSTTNDSTNTHIKYINRVPKITVNEYSTFTHPTNKHLMLLIDNDNKQAIVPLLTDSLRLQNEHKLFWIDEQQLSTLIHDIIQTTGKYVYPMIFVNYLKQSLSINEKINFDNNLLLYIRIWSNQIRELARQFTTSKIKPIHMRIQSNPDIRYIGYKICCELLYYYKNIYKKQ